MEREPRIRERSGRTHALESRLSTSFAIDVLGQALPSSANDCSNLVHLCTKLNTVHIPGSIPHWTYTVCSLETRSTDKGHVKTSLFQAMTAHFGLRVARNPSLEGGGSYEHVQVEHR
jgi:hypothetical protein